ncbi:sulfotransferase [Erythrobacter litoralis]|uniref:sulfotransferase n=1 Tax=Erythrobacter litoralis TaxID=39960 RepID=UPI0024358BCB|nr:sulfotransferase [Erythrobacter litoralis]
MSAHYIRASQTKRLPNLIVPGAMKAGTTALAATLGAHPDIFVHPMKEPMFFAQTPQSRERLCDLLSPDGTSYTTVTPHETRDFLDVETFADSFAGGEDVRYRLDASTMYLQSPDAIAGARQTIPDTKFVAVLRDPYERAYSAYNYQRSRMREPAGTFAEAIAHERSGARDGWAYGWRYIFTSLYADQIARLFAAVPVEDRLVMLFDNIVGEEGMGEVWRFLDLAPIRPELKVANETVLPQGKAARMAASLLNNQQLGGRIRRVLPTAMVRPLRRTVSALRGIVAKTGSRPDPMTAADRVLMSDLIEPDIDRLERLLGRDLTDWRCDRAR